MRQKKPLRHTKDAATPSLDGGALVHALMCILSYITSAIATERAARKATTPAAAPTPHVMSQFWLVDEVFVPLKAASTIFGKHPCTLRRWEKNKRLPPRRLKPGGRQTGWLASELAPILKSLELCSRPLS